MIHKQKEENNMACNHDCANCPFSTCGTNDDDDDKTTEEDDDDDDKE